MTFDEAPRPPRFPPLRAVARALLLGGGTVVALVLGFVAFYELRPGPDIEITADGRAPGFDLQAADGSRVRLADLRGRPVLVNFWGAWCAPCLTELPAFAAFSKAHPEVTVLGVAVDPGDARRLASLQARLAIPYPVLVADGAVVEAYGASVLPTTVLIDPDGRVAETWTGRIFEWQLSAAAAPYGNR